MIAGGFDELVPLVGVKPACAPLGTSTATHCRSLQGPRLGPARPRGAPPNALSVEERAAVLAALHEPEHVDVGVTQVWARLLDIGIYLCSIAAMYRILTADDENRERRRQRTHPAETKPQLHRTLPEGQPLTIIAGVLRQASERSGAVGLDLLGREECCTRSGRLGLPRAATLPPPLLGACRVCSRDRAAIPRP